MWVVPVVRSMCAAPEDWYLTSILKAVPEVVNLPPISKPVALLRLSVAPLISCEVDAWPMPKGRLHAAARSPTNATMTILRMALTPDLKKMARHDLPGHPTGYFACSIALL